MNSQQPLRYIKNRMGDELKNKILERNGIKIAVTKTQVSRTCGSCGYVNKLESKFCEAKGCHYPQTQLALDEIKAAEQLKMKQLVNESNLERDNTIQALQQELKSWEEVAEKMKVYIDRQKKEEGERMKRLMKEKQWYVSKYGLSEPFKKKPEESLEQIRDLPDSEYIPEYDD